MLLLAATSVGHWLLVILQVSLGLGAVIFVHELGHFAVAKMCGVKCDKFFIGFDIGGYKISRKWGETEYGIGILPLGGYVKMMGQDDNPANIAEQVRESQVSEESSTETKEITGPDGKNFRIDRRSYLAKSVPQRMAIISAGVIMNVLFAFIFAVIAFGVGAPYIPCIVSQTAPGSAAYQAGIRTGDEITRIGDVHNPSFTELRSGVTLGDLDNGIPFTIRRADTHDEETVVLKPQQGAGLAKVGIFSPSSLRLAKEHPVADDSPAAAASPPLEGGDEIIKVNGTPVEDYRQFVAQLVERPELPLEITVRRGGKAPKEDRFGEREGGEEVTMTVPARAMRRTGLVMEMGKIVAVQQGSPAAEKGIQADDFIDRITKVGDSPAVQETPGHRPFSDPIALPEQLRKLAEEIGDIRLTVRSSSTDGDGRKEIDVPLRKVSWVENSWVANDPLSATALGIAYRVLNRVDNVLPGSPAAKVGLQRGDVVIQAEFILTDQETNSSAIEFDEEGQQNWPMFIQLLQNLPKDTQVKLTYRRSEKILEATLLPIPLDDQFVMERGFIFEPIQRMRKASSIGEQLSLGYQETKNSLGMVFRFLRKLGTQIPLTALGGPVTIAQAAGYSAFEGVGKLLLFLTILSANLAVINFLPIPLLDGGHMVFLAWEGLRGRPVNERFVIALHTVGFVFIITLMLFVLALDLKIIPRNI